MIDKFLLPLNQLGSAIRKNTSNESIIALCESASTLPFRTAAWIRGTTEVARGRANYITDVRPFFLDPMASIFMGKDACIELAPWDHDFLAKGQSKEHGLPVIRGFPNASGIGIDPHWDYVSPSVTHRTRIFLRRGSKLRIGPNSLIYRGCYLRLWAGTSLDIGCNVVVANDTIINSRSGLTIGHGSMIGQRVLIMDYDGHPVFKKDGTLLVERYGGDVQKISIGKGVWIGTGAMILKGASIGDGAIVGAGSVVTGHVPPNSIVAGNPAKVVREDITWTKY